jgi:hypothetical protein
MNTFFAPIEHATSASRTVLKTALSSLVVVVGVAVVRVTVVGILLLGSISIITDSRIAGVAQA